MPRLSSVLLPKAFTSYADLTCARRCCLRYVTNRRRRAEEPPKPSSTQPERDCGRHRRLGVSGFQRDARRHRPLRERAGLRRSGFVSIVAAEDIGDRQSLLHACEGLDGRGVEGAGVCGDWHVLCHAGERTLLCEELSFPQGADDRSVFVRGLFGV